MNIIDKLLNRSSIQDNGCWMFLGCWNRDGYGNIKYQGKSYGAHRLSYELFIGPIPQNKSVLHHCDNPWCINPDHLFIGTQLDNVHDMIEKGRDNFTTNRQLTEDQVEKVRAILSEEKYSLSQIGSMFNVSANIIWGIKQGKYYR